MANIREPEYDEPRGQPGFRAQVVYPDSGKLGAFERLADGGGPRALFRSGDAVDYYEASARPNARAGCRRATRRRLHHCVEPRGMLALLLAVALIALTVLALLLFGVVAAVVTGVGLLNAMALLIGLRHERRPAAPSVPDRWRPTSFRRPPEPPLEPEAEEHLHSHSLTVHRR